MKFTALLITFFLVPLVVAQFICIGEPSETNDISRIEDDVIVEAGTRCILSSSTLITGSIRVRKDATLIITSRAIIRGDIRGETGSTLEIGSSTTVDMQLVVRGGKSVTVSGRIKRAVDIFDTPFELTGSGRVDRIKAGGNSMVKVIGPRTFVRQGIQMGGKGAGGDCSVEMNGSNVFGGIRIDGCQNAPGTGSRVVLKITEQSTVHGEIFVQNGRGSVEVEHSDLREAALNVNVPGGVVNLGHTFFKSINLLGVSNLFMDNGLVSGRVSAQFVTDDVRIRRSQLDGDVMLDDVDKNAIVTENTFKEGTLTVKRARLSVEIRRNTNFAARILDNGFPPFQGSEPAPITLFENKQLSTLLSENNKGKITVENNEIGKITCRNNKEVVGSGNQISCNVGCPVS